MGFICMLHVAEHRQQTGPRCRHCGHQFPRERGIPVRQFIRDVVFPACLGRRDGRLMPINRNEIGLSAASAVDRAGEA